MSSNDHSPALCVSCWYNCVVTICADCSLSAGFVVKPCSNLRLTSFTAPDNGGHVALCVFTCVCHLTASNHSYSPAVTCVLWQMMNFFVRRSYNCQVVC